jgi:hypothetical protein
MDVPNGIAIILVLVHKSQIVRVSLLVWIHTLTHGDTVALYYCCQAYDFFLPCRCKYCCVRWLECQTMKMILLSSSYKRSLFHESGSTRKRIRMSSGASWHWPHDLVKITYTYHVLFHYWRTTALKFLLDQYKEAYAKVLQPKPLSKLSST